MTAAHELEPARTYTHARCGGIIVVIRTEQRPYHPPEEIGRCDRCGLGGIIFNPATNGGTNH